MLNFDTVPMPGKLNSMIVTQKPDAKPICDAHHTLMQFARYEAADIQMVFHAYSCREPGCTRVYQHGQGYHDIVVGGSVSFEHRLRKECPECQVTMYLASVIPPDENWECGQKGCDYRETVERSPLTDVAT